MNDAVASQGYFPVFFAQQMNPIFLDLQADRAEDSFLLEKRDDFSDFHRYPFPAFSSMGKRRKTFLVIYKISSPEIESNPRGGPRLFKTVCNRFFSANPFAT